MIYARLAINNPLGGSEPLVFTVVPHPGYGSTPELVHDTLMLGLTAEWPCLMTADGDLVRIPAGAFRALRIWSSDSEAGPPHP